MDPDINILNEVRQRKMWYQLHVESKKKDNKLIYKTETDSQTYKTNLWSQR